MQTAIWGMCHFSTYLRGWPFTLFTNHKPLEKMGKVHTKTLNHLLEVMQTYNFKIAYKRALRCLPTICPITYYCHHPETNSTAARTRPQSLVQVSHITPPTLGTPWLYEKDAFVEDGRLDVNQNWVEPSNPSLKLWCVMMYSRRFTGNQLAQHDGLYKAKEPALQCYYWPSLNTDIAANFGTCHYCQTKKTVP